MSRRTMECRRLSYMLAVQLILLSLQAAVHGLEPPFLLYANRDDETQGVTMTSLDGRNSEKIITNMTASGLDYDFEEKVIFWSDIDTESICMSALNGSNVRVIVDDTSDPENIGWDWVNKKLYWTDVTRGTLEVMDIKTGYRKTLVTVGREKQIRGLQLDPINRWMYWTTIAMNEGRIARTSMDGAETMVLHDSSIVGFPNGLALDPSSDTLYWVDAGSDNKNIIGKSSTELSSPSMTVYRFPTRRIPFHAAYYSGRLYYTEWRSGNVSRLDLDSTPTRTTIVDGDNRLGMIRVFAQAKQQSFSNPCSGDGVQCTQLCLLSTVDPRGYSCACTEGVELNPDGYSCGPDVPTTSSSTPPPITNGPTALCGTTILCENGGTCEDTVVNQFVCHCRNGYTGTFCEIEPSIIPPLETQNDNMILGYVLGIVGILAFVIIVSLGLLLFAFLVRSKTKKRHRTASIDGLSTSSESPSAHFVLVNGRMSVNEHDYMSIKSRGNSPAPSRILICNVGEQGGTVPNNYIYEHVRPLPTSGSQTLDHAFISHKHPPTNGPQPSDYITFSAMKPPASGSQTLDHAYSASKQSHPPPPPPPEPIYNTVKTGKRLTL